jgi:hypothetical protein
MADLVVHQFEDEQAAKDFFAVVINSAELKGCYFKAPGRLYKFAGGTLTSLDEELKYYVVTSTADAISDFGV